MKVESNYSYLSSEVAAAEMRDQEVPVGEWLTARTSFHLRGGWGGAGSREWKDNGCQVNAGQRFRLLFHGNPWSAAVWEIE